MELKFLSICNLFQIDFGDYKYLSGIKTKGFQGTNSWVELFQLSYSSDDGQSWSTIKNKFGNTDRVFMANYDSDSVVSQYFDNMIFTRYVKIHPVKWNSNIGMRLELIGCYEPHIASTLKSTTVTPVPAAPAPCHVCPGLPGPFINPTNNKTCNCDGLVWDGSNCIEEHMCPCYYKSIR